MRILHVAACISPRYGGPSKVLPEMCRALAARGHEVELVSTDLDARNLRTRLDVPLGTTVEGGYATSIFRAYPPRSWVFSPGLGAYLARRIADADVVHVHSIYLFPTALACALSRRHGRPYFVRPHGTLHAFHRARHPVRKRIYEALIERRNVRLAAGIHFTSEDEREQADAYGVEGRPFVIPLGVDPAELEGTASSSRIPNGRLVTFIGRLTAGKGADILLDAFARVAGDHPDAVLAIAGPDGEGIGAGLLQRAHAAGLGERVRVLGLVDAEQKSALLQRSTVFALPSAKESFGVAAAEAMAAGAPVVVTPGVAIHAEIAAAEAGLVVERTPAAVAGALSTLLGDPALAARLGANGRVLARSAYSWERVAEELERMYRTGVEESR